MSIAERTEAMNVKRDEARDMFRQRILYVCTGTERLSLVQSNTIIALVMDAYQRGSQDAIDAIQASR